MIVLHIWTIYFTFAGLGWDVLAKKIASMKVTFDGLKNYPKQREVLRQIADALARCAESETGHLGDITSLIRTSMSSLDLLATNISEEAAKQKSDNQ